MLAMENQWKINGKSMIALENPPSMIVLLQRLSIALHFVCKLEGCDSQIIFGIPSVYLAMENHQFFSSKSSISGPCSIAMLDYQRLSPVGLPEAITNRMLFFACP